VRADAVGDQFGRGHPDVTMIVEHQERRGRHARSLPPLPPQQRCDAAGLCQDARSRALDGDDACVGREAALDDPLGQARLVHEASGARPRHVSGVQPPVLAEAPVVADVRVVNERFDAGLVEAATTSESPTAAAPAASAVSRMSRISRSSRTSCAAWSVSVMVSASSAGPSQSSLRASRTVTSRSSGGGLLSPQREVDELDEHLCSSATTSRSCASIGKWKLAISGAVMAISSSLGSRQ
jgi:hypothetical protein